MSKTNTIRGTYGAGKTPCDVYTHETRDGSTWYAVHGSANVNLSPEPLADGVDVEEIPDIDAFTWNGGIHSEEQLTAAVDA